MLRLLRNQNPSAYASSRKVTFNNNSVTLGTRGFFRHNREHKLQPETAQEKPLAPRVQFCALRRKRFNAAAVDTASNSFIRQNVHLGLFADNL